MNPDTTELFDRSHALWRTEVGRIYREHSKLLWRIFFSRCNDASIASDAVQESFHKLLRQSPGKIRQPLSWLRLVGKNYIIDRARRRSPESGSDVLPDIPASDSTEAWEYCSENERRARVIRAMRQLSEIDRRVLLLRYVHHQSSQQIGLATGKSANAIDMCLSRARQRLAIAMQSV